MDSYSHRLLRRVIMRCHITRHFETTWREAGFARRKTMPNITTVLKEEILRLSRKEIRRQTSVLKKMSAQYRRDIAEMKRRMSELQRKVTPLQKQLLRAVSSQPTESGEEHVRFTAKGLRSQRQRLGLSAANYGKL